MQGNDIKGPSRASGARGRGGVGDERGLGGEA